MLDERTSCLLKIINEKCSEGSYKVVSMDELVLAFPTRYAADGDLIRQMMTALASGGYVSLRYDRDSEFCLTPTPKGREYYESSAVETVKSSKFSRVIPYFYYFLANFFGVFLAVLVLRLLGVLC